MSKDKERLREGLLISFEEGIMSGVKDRANYKKRLDDFVNRQNAMCGNESEVSLCWKCDGTEVLYQNLCLPLITNNKRFKSVKLIAAICSMCGEEYINEREARQIEETVMLINAYCGVEDNDDRESISNCDVCKSNNVNNTAFEVLLISNNSKIVSITLKEDYCLDCNTVYYADDGDQLTMEHLRYFYLTK